MTAMKRFFPTALALAWSGFVLTGCQKAEAPPLIPVIGEVVNENGPVAGAWIEFHPDHGRSSSGMTDARGQFQLRYTIEHDGALPGAHTVHFHLPPKEMPKVPTHYNEQERKEFVERHRQPAKIRYEERVEVTKSGDRFHFDLTGKSAQ